jgi:hypothetical protein
MPIKVIGAGLGRTGTLSLKLALEELGFARCYHMVEVLAHPDDARIWDAAARGQPVDWDALFHDYQATVDWPGCSFYEQLMQHYPDARVVLTVRDPERWYDSAYNTIYYVKQAFPRWITPLFPRMRNFRRMVDRLIWDGTFHGRFEDRAHAIEVFNQHNERVRRIVPPERLLVFEVREGWEPLCAFLRVPVPASEPFPHKNDTAEFRSGILRGVRIMRAVLFTIIALAVLILGWAASRILR